jgi:hypothetical protein
MHTAITFDNNHISQRTSKNILLDIETNEPHDCPARRSNGHPQQQLQQSQEQHHTQRRYHQCNKGCGQEIYFDANDKSQRSGRWIPLSKDTGQRHQCIIYPRS